MTTWITTVGWSPFAVINPIWAYCKEYIDLPEKVILIHTQNRQIEINLDLVRRYVFEIMRVYSKLSFKKENIVVKTIQSEDVQTYADNLRAVITSEIKNKPKKIILDMTPGRKYMSAINVYYGLKDTTVPIQVFYLHLEESKYQDVPYPLTPITKNALIDIVESTEVFTDKMEGFEDDEKTNQIREVLPNLDEEEKYIVLALMAISLGFQSVSKISKYFYDLRTQINSSTLKQVLFNCKKKKFIGSKMMKNKSTEFQGYYLISEGKKYLVNLGLKGGSI